MRVLKDLFPYNTVETVFDIDYQRLLEKGYKAVLFDIDATLVPHGAEMTKEIRTLFQEIQEKGLQIFLLSNNSPERIGAFIEGMEIPFIALADKPKPTNYLRALKKLQLSPAQAIFVGDQLFTDILGANRAQIASILVRYLTFPGEARISKKRLIEACCLTVYRLSPYYQRLGNIKKEK